MLDSSKNTQQSSCWVFVLGNKPFKSESDGSASTLVVFWCDRLLPVCNWNVEPNQSQGSHICETQAPSRIHQDSFTCQVPELFALLCLHKCINMKTILPFNNVCGKEESCITTPFLCNSILKQLNGTNHCLVNYHLMLCNLTQWVSYSPSYVMQFEDPMS